MWLQILIVTITLSAVLITIFLAYRSYNQNRLTALSEFNGQQLILARSAAAGIETLFAEVKAALSAAASLPAIQRMSPECLDYMRHMSGGFLPKAEVNGGGSSGSIAPSLTSWAGLLNTSRSVVILRN